MKQIHQDLLAILEAVEIESQSRYHVLGAARDVAERVRDDNGSEPGPASLVSALSLDLYDRLYIRPLSGNLVGADELAQRDFLAALSAANTGRGLWESGWTVRRIEVDGRVGVAKGDFVFWAAPGEVRTGREPMEPGDQCRVWLAKEQRALIPGFYLAIGDAAGEDDGGGERAEREGRFYWHLTSDAAVPFIAIATSLLNESRVQFRAKVLSDPNFYHRADAGVIYFRRRDDHRIDPIIARIHSAIAPLLRPDVPLFTKRLSSGLGMAESPDSRASFGEHRCRLVAQALWDSFSRRETDRSARVTSLATAFLKEGIDPLRPYLGLGESDEYVTRHLLDEMPAERTGSPSVRQVTVPFSSSETSSTVSMLDAAARIGLTLCRTAYWSRDGRLCNWIGRTGAEVSGVGSPITPTSAALGPSVYAGTAGIALFLSQLHLNTGEGEFAHTALGAIRHSIREFDRTPLKAPLSPLSFFSGDLGAAYVARRVGIQTEHAEFLVFSRSILDHVVESAAQPHMLDVIGGNAGAIPVLLAMSREPGLDRCGALATVLGGELCAVDPAESGVSGRGWDRPPGLDLDQFTPSGLSHGASGLGLALLELYAATGQLEFRDAARRSFEYEDTLFEPHERNWADLRRPSGRVIFDRYWCNGAPGIALARLRAATLDPDRAEDYLAKARVALATTLDAIDENLRFRRADTSLCHGLAGLGEILLIAGQLLDEPTYAGRALALAQVLIARFGSSGDWPSGLPSGGPNPSLMLGLAGIGYWLLRLHDPARVPSFLLLIP